MGQARVRRNKTQISFLKTLKLVTCGEPFPTRITRTAYYPSCFAILHRLQCMPILFFKHQVCTSSHKSAHSDFLCLSPFIYYVLRFVVDMMCWREANFHQLGLQVAALSWLPDRRQRNK